MSEVLTVAAQEVEKRLNRALLRKFGLTYPQYRCLKALVEMGDASLGDIARWLGCSRGNVTGMLERLEEWNWITKTQDPQDRRVWRVKLVSSDSLPEVEALMKSISPTLPPAVEQYLANLAAGMQGVNDH